AGKPILWLDLPWVNDGGKGEETHDGEYTSSAEVSAITTLLRRLRPDTNHDAQTKVAVLSPYRRQVFAMTKELRRLYDDADKPPWLAPLEDRQPPAHTVDAFQGNQAKVVIVSLVRNNSGDLRQPIGFLQEDSRMNVLFSRAEQLLVLVGSW